MSQLDYATPIACCNKIIVDITVLEKEIDPGQSDPYLIDFEGALLLLDVSISESFPTSVLNARYQLNEDLSGSGLTNWPIILTDVQAILTALQKAFSDDGKSQCQQIINDINAKNFTAATTDINNLSAWYNTNQSVKPSLSNWVTYLVENLSDIATKAPLYITTLNVIIGALDEPSSGMEKAA